MDRRQFFGGALAAVFGLAVREAEAQPADMSGWVCTKREAVGPNAQPTCTQWSRGAAARTRAIEPPPFAARGPVAAKPVPTKPAAPVRVKRRRKHRRRKS